MSSVKYFRRKKIAISIPKPKLLLRFDNNDVSDLSDFNHPYTFPNGFEFNTSVFKQGTASLRCRPQKPIIYSKSPDWNFYGSEFCVEFWAYSLGAQSIGHIIGTANPYFGGGDAGGTGSTYGGGWGLRADATALVFVGSGNSQCIYPYQFPVNQWVHIAWTRQLNAQQNSTFRLFVNGQIHTTNGAGGLANDSVNGLHLGCHGSFPDYAFNGLLDLVRITKGSPVYTSDFTPSIY